MLCADIVERFELLIQLSLILLSYPKNPGTTVYDYLSKAFTAFICEIVFLKYIKGC